MKKVTIYMDSGMTYEFETNKAIEALFSNESETPKWVIVPITCPKEGGQIHVATEHIRFVRIEPAK